MIDVITTALREPIHFASRGNNQALQPTSSKNAMQLGVRTEEQGDRFTYAIPSRIEEGRPLGGTLRLPFFVSDRKRVMDYQYLCCSTEEINGLCDMLHKPS